MPQENQFNFPSGVAFQQLGDDQDAVMMSLSSGYLYRCNSTATAVLAAIAAGKSDLEAAKELVELFDIDIEQAKYDVEFLLEDLCERRLVCKAA